jgi:hypothetical protein
MLITLGRIADGDFGEESLTARFLVALILNEYASVNLPDGKAFRLFARRCLGIDPSFCDIKRGASAVEFKPNRCGTGGDNTKFDVILSLDGGRAPCLWGIEAKYFYFLKVAQTEREIESIRALAIKKKYDTCGILFVLPEEALLKLIKKKGRVSQHIRCIMRQEDIHVRLASWEMIFGILTQVGPPEMRTEIEDYVRVRNENMACYRTKLSTNPIVEDCCDWHHRVCEEEPAKPLEGQLPTDREAVRRSLRELARGKGVLGLFDELSGALLSRFKWTLVSKSTMPFTHRKRGQKNSGTLFCVYPERSSERTGLAVGIWLERIAHHLDIPLQGIQGALGNLEGEALPRWPGGRLYRFRDFASFRKVLDLFTD